MEGEVEGPETGGGGGSLLHCEVSCMLGVADGPYGEGTAIWFNDVS
jgi:hypothetical protein